MPRPTAYERPWFRDKRNLEPWFTGTERCIATPSISVQTSMFHRPRVPLTLHLSIRSTTLSQCVWYGRWPLPYPLPIRYPNHHHPYNMHHYDYLTCAQTASIDNAL